MPSRLTCTRLRTQRPTTATGARAKEGDTGHLLVACWYALMWGSTTGQLREVQHNLKESGFLARKPAQANLTMSSPIFEESRLPTRTNWRPASGCPAQPTRRSRRLRGQTAGLTSRCPAQPSGSAGCLRGQMRARLRDVKQNLQGVPVACEGKLQAKLRHV